MKKFLFWTALASVALTGCVKNEMEPNPSLGQDVEITFNQPVVGKVTRANNTAAITSATYPANEYFTVNAWAYQNEFSTAISDTTNFKEYINGVTAKQKDGQTYWNLVTSYYWPKTHNLAFSAYSPAEFEATAKEIFFNSGIFLKDVKTPTNIDDHYDLLYSNRVVDQKERTYYDEGSYVNNSKVGVDVKFNHAFAAVVVKVKLNNNYPNNEIVIKDIKFDNIYFTGSFNENISSVNYKDADPEWGAYDDPCSNFSIFDNNGTGDTDNNSIVVEKETVKQFGTTALFIPQEINRAGEHVKLTVDYTIENANSTILEERLVFDLSNREDASVPANIINKWEMGKRYIYTLTFGLNEIYLQPSVQEWTDVYVNFEDVDHE